MRNGMMLYELIILRQITLNSELETVRNFSMAYICRSNENTGQKKSSTPLIRRNKKYVRGAA